MAGRVVLIFNVLERLDIFSFFYYRTLGIRSLLFKIEEGERKKKGWVGVGRVLGSFFKFSFFC